ncbi:hypothetical protein [Enterovibrio calviensis]|uniref:hypothetical protein n=1 Tax=Enterovibrio calviensis TaxID=91359 RepID=UPI003734D86A
MVRFFGILILVLGYLNVVSSYHEVGLIEDVEKQRVSITAQIEKELDEALTEEEVSRAAYNSYMFQSTSKFFDFPVWFKTWCSTIAIFSLLIAIALSYVGLVLIWSALKHISLNILYAVFGVSIVWSVLKTSLYYFSGVAYLSSQLPMLIRGLTIEVALLAVVTWYIKRSAPEKYNKNLKPDA